ncbi:MAG: hypothetical protein ABSG45_05535 [Nitrososphaerales archaeon]
MSTESGGKDGTGVEKVFEEFNKSWLTYWDAYVDLQNQLYESIKTAREVSWLAATDTAKMSEINSAQRELFSTMPRRMDYMPLGQISRDLDSAVSKLEELENALSVEKEKCKRLELATDVLQERARRTKEELLAAKR